MKELQGIKKQTNKTIILIVVHIILWTIFLFLPSIFKPRPPGTPLSISFMVDDMMSPPRWTNALLLMCVFYFNYYFVFRKLYLYRRYILLAVSFVICFSLFFFLNYSLTPDDVKRMPSGGFEALGNSFNLFMFLIVYAASFSICLYEQWQKTKEQMLNTEISFLKAQINPHFLFNTLNSIYSLAITKSDNAPDAIVKLSGMMRYSISEANHNFVSLSKELEYINNYIDLQELRLTERIKIEYCVKGDADGMQIAPFLLIPFVENAFKHGVNTEQDCDIKIGIEIDDRSLKLQVINKKVPIRAGRDTGAGLGIGTTRKRLMLLYPGTHTLNITDNNENFSVLLQIHL